MEEFEHTFQEARVPKQFRGRYLPNCPDRKAGTVNVPRDARADHEATKSMLMYLHSKYPSYYTSSLHAWTKPLHVSGECLAKCQAELCRLYSKETYLQFAIIKNTLLSGYTNEFIDYVLTRIFPRYNHICILPSSYLEILLLSPNMKLCMGMQPASKFKGITSKPNPHSIKSEEKPWSNQPAERLEQEPRLAEKKQPFIRDADISCFLCHKRGHRAAMCPLMTSNENDLYKRKFVKICLKKSGARCTPNVVHN